MKKYNTYIKTRKKSMIDKINLIYNPIEKEPFDQYLCTGLQNNFNIEWEKAENEYLYVKGLDKRVIDFTSGILVNCRV